MTQTPDTLDEYLKRGLRVLLLDGYARQVLPMAEYLHRLGATVATLNTSWLDVGYVTRWADERYLGPDVRQDSPGTLGRVRALLETGSFDIVIPLSDLSADLLAENKPELSEYAAICVNDMPVYEKVRDKLQTMAVCAELDLPHPRTLDASLPDLPDRLRAMGLEAPLIVKPRKSSGSIGLARVDRLTDVLDVVCDVTEKFGPALVQEYIPHTDLQYKCQLMVDSRVQIRGDVTFSKVRWFPLHGGNSTLNVAVERPDIVDCGGRLLQAIGWRGYGDVDLIQDPRDGVAKIMEVNPRVTGSVKICFDVGVDFARQIVEDALNLPITTYPGHELGRRLRYMHTDILWFLLSPDRWRTQPSWFDFRRTTDQICSFRDPLPGITYSLQAFGKLRKWTRKRKTGN